jgi:hypothetical protein
VEKGFLSFESNLNARDDSCLRSKLFLFVDLGAALIGLNQRPRHNSHIIYYDIFDFEIQLELITVFSINFLLNNSRVTLPLTVEEVSTKIV